MTYAWPDATSIFRMRCVADTAAGKRCKRERWITTGEVGDEGYRCHLHKLKGKSA